MAHRAGGPSRRQALSWATGAAVTAAVVAACAPEGPDSDEEQEAAVARLDVVDSAGVLLDFDGLRRVQSNGAGEDGWDDQLLDTDTLEVLAHAPLYEDDEASAAVDLPDGGAATLTLSWPTGHGYSALMADIPGPGRYSLAELAARSLHGRQQPRLDALTSSRTRTEVQTLRDGAAAALDACSSSSDPVERAVHGAEALEAAAGAQLALDEAGLAVAPHDAVIGVTFTRPPDAAQISQATGIGGGQRRVAARIVVDDTADADEMDSWRRTIAALHAAGALALVQVCDSQTMTAFGLGAWDARVASLVTGLSQADAWEIGNELGGSWLGDDAVEKTLRAARAVRADPATADATTVVTLYYQLGQESAESSLLTWAGNGLVPELLDLTDVLGLSVYPQLHPLGTGADRVLSTLAEAFPDQRVALTELGYGGDDLDSGPWWFGSQQDTATARTATARHLTSAALGRERAWGAPFWWYYLQDEEPGAPGGPVDEVLSDVAAGSQDR
ncbi:Tat pathway signal sequence [Actinomyces gerencseriae]|uniref:Tat pathway signal sequence n=1 Tax=Actinomyces gerencseriae TaxID=52769 RepID=UPI0023F49AFF|nr:Tat pathway signal sequence [Actinomyces gerencseriae]